MIGQPPQQGIFKRARRLRARLISTPEQGQSPALGDLDWLERYQT
jgi:hypothetical protein